MRLFIAEKPSVAKAIAAELGVTNKGDGFITCGPDTITWCFGHMLEQAEPDEYTPEDVPRTPKGKKMWRVEDLPIIPEQWILRPKPDAKKQLAVIGKLIKQAQEIVNAGDPDREGQLLVDEVLEHFKNTKPVLRFWVSAQDSTSIKRGLAALKDNRDYKGWADAAKARSRADWLIGMNLSRAFTLKASRGGSRVLLTVGRVQTPTLALIVQRDTTIENFKSIPFHTIKAGFSHANGAFVAAWKPCEDQPGLDNEGRLTDTKIADAIVAQFTKKQGVIAEYKQEPKKQNQPLAFALSDITALASSKFGYSAEDVLKTCQSLYETHKLTSYPRTDCAYLPESQHADAKAVLAALKTVNPDLAGLIDGANPSIKSPTWNDAKITAHHGIIPTMHTGSKSGLNEKERNIYELIVRAYIAQFYPAHEYLSTKIAVEVEGESFTATGKTVTKNGWKDVFEQQDDDDKKEDSQTIPVMRQHDSVLCQQGKRFDQQTKPPARFTEGTLIRAMESIHKFIDDPEQKKILRDGDGIGTSATRATIIADLKRRGFVEAKGKAVISTPLGRELIAALPSQVKSAAMTAIYERILKQIEEQKADLEDFCQKQAEFVRGQVEKANAGALHLAQHNPPAGKKPAYKTRPIKRKKT